MRLPLIAAAIAASLTLIAGATDAVAQGAYYVAVPEARASKPSLITRSTPWRLRGDAYFANRAPERELVLCQLLARDVGRLRSFSAGGAALDGAALDKCNSRAKSGPTAVAAR